MVAAVAVSVAALTAGGSSGPGEPGRGRGRQRRHHRVRTHHRGPTPTTIVATTVPAPAPDTAPAEAQTPPAVEQPPIAPVVGGAHDVQRLGHRDRRPGEDHGHHHVQRSGGHVHRHRRRFRELLGERSAGRRLRRGRPVGRQHRRRDRRPKFGTVSVTGNSSVSFAFSS